MRLGQPVSAPGSRPGLGKKRNGRGRSSDTALEGTQRNRCMVVCGKPTSPGLRRDRSARLVILKA